MIGRVLNSLDTVSLLDLALALVEKGQCIIRATAGYCFSPLFGLLSASLARATPWDASPVPKVCRQSNIFGPSGLALTGIDGGISPVKSASLQRLIARCWRVSRYLSGETSPNRSSGELRTSHVEGSDMVG